MRSCTLNHDQSKPKNVLPEIKTWTPLQSPWTKDYFSTDNGIASSNESGCTQVRRYGKCSSKLLLLTTHIISPEVSPCLITKSVLRWRSSAFWHLLHNNEIVSTEQENHKLYNWNNNKKASHLNYINANQML